MLRDPSGAASVQRGHQKVGSATYRPSLGLPDPGLPDLAPLIVLPFQSLLKTQGLVVRCKMGPQGAAVRRRGPETGVDVILHHGHRIQRFAEARRFAALYAGILRAVVPAGRRFGRSEPPGRFTTRHKEGARGWSSESRTALSPTAPNVRRSRKSVQPSLTASNNTPTSRTRPAAFNETMRSPRTR